MAILYPLNYNNYYNRIIKKENSLAAYIQYMADGAEALGPVNFVPNDGVSTEHIINWNFKDPDYLVVVENNEIVSRWFVIEATRTRAQQLKLTLRRDVIADNYDAVIEAPVFIEKATLDASNPLIFNKEQMDYNQIKDNEELLTDETGCPWIVGYVDRGSTLDNEEEYDYERIVYAKNKPVDITVNGIQNYIYYGTNGVYRDNRLRDVESTWYFKYDDAGDHKAHIKYNFTQNDFDLRYLTEPLDTYQNVPEIRAIWRKPEKKYIEDCLYALKSTIVNDVSTHIGSNGNWDKLVAEEGKIIYDATNDKYYRVKIEYGHDPDDSSLLLHRDYYITDSYPELYGDYSYFLDLISNYITLPQGNLVKAFYINYSYNAIALTLQEILYVEEYRTLQFNTYNNRYHPNKVPYDVFCIPYADNFKTINIESSQTVPSMLVSSKEEALAAAMAIAQQYTDKVYDIQLLPYCPIHRMWDRLSEAIDASKGSVDYINEFSGSGIGDKVCPIFWVSDPEFTFNIDKEIDISRNFLGNNIVRIPKNYNTTGTNYDYIIYPDKQGHLELTIPEGITGVNSVIINGISKTILNAEIHNTTLNLVLGEPEYNYDYPSTITANYTINLSYEDVVNVPQYENSLEIDTKVESETSTYRLNSPNFAAMFEFNVAKNRGPITQFAVDCSYKPYTPYIHVVPVFGANSLYGQHFFNNSNDAIGLICSGDFSITTDKDRFAQYELNNKNYQLAFDREIQNLDKNQKITEWQTTLTGARQGLTSMLGVGTGAASGNALSTVAGISGTANAGMGLISNTLINEARYEEARDYRIDQFNYALGNIKALPNTINKVTALNNNNKLFPTLEHYTCTDVEKKALIDKITYNGMTTMVIGKISDYIRGELTYIKGKLIRLEGVSDDYHMINTIADELFKGVFI